MSDNKTINGYLRVDWKSEQITGRKTKPNASDLAANEILVPIEINVTIAVTPITTPRIVSQERRLLFLIERQERLR